MSLGLSPVFVCFMESLNWKSFGSLQSTCSCIPFAAFSWKCLALLPSSMACERLQEALITLPTATDTAWENCFTDGDKVSLWSSPNTISAEKSPSLSGRGPGIASSTNLEMFLWTNFNRFETIMWSTKRTKVPSLLTSSRASFKLCCLTALFFFATASDSW